MFKHTKYFLIIFVITTVIPIISIFMWTNHQLKKMEEKGSQHLIYVGKKQLANSVEQYLKIREGIILEKLQNLPSSEVNESSLKKAFPDDKIEFIYNKNINKMSAEYKVNKNAEGQKAQIYNEFLIPLKNSQIKGIKIVEKTDFDELNIKGPFVVEVYAQNKIVPEAFISYIKDPFMPDKEKKKQLFGPLIDQNAYNLGLPLDSTKNFGIKQIYDNEGNIVATLLIKTIVYPKHIGPMKFLENSFGFIIFFAALTLSLLIAYYINRNFINPLLTLSEASKEVQKGNLNIQIGTTIKNDPIVNTFNNFNAMIKGLREKEKLRTSFITSLTHDLRTPLIAQERCLSFISQKFKELELSEEYDLAKSLEKNNLHLLRMVNIILESYQFDAQKQELSLNDVNLSKLIDDCFEKLKPLLDDKNIETSNRISKDFADIKADITSMQRVFINLISNALENISTDGKIEIKAEIKEDSLQKFVLITVEDNGPGIAKEDLEHIFEQYFTGKSLDRKLGSGLGLYVCKRLIELHRGEIAVQSQIGEYTRFLIKLPFEIRNKK